ncbi:MAG: hypothetical protein N2Z76_08605 [Treponemataceae bacterium]|nr:hypothetical protein [Treponemataceae bacterium]
MTQRLNSLKIIVWLPFWMVVLGVGEALFLFIEASPVVVVTDHYEVALYGKERIQKACIRSALGLWKPLYLVYGENGEDPERLILKIEMATSKPSLVIFPSWFSEEAFHYALKYPQVPLGVWLSEGDLKKDPLFSSFPMYIGRIDYGKDMENLVSSVVRENPLLVPLLKVDEESWGESLREKVQESLERAVQDRINIKRRRKGGENEQPVFSLPATENDGTSLWIIGPASVKVLDEKGSYVVYSWQDPLVVPPSVRVLLDDSRWPHLVSFAKDIWRREKQKEDRQIWYTSSQRVLKK